MSNRKYFLYKFLAFFVGIIVFPIAFAEENSEIVTIVNMPKLNSAVVKFPSFDPMRVLLSDSEIMSDLMNLLSKKTNFPLKKSYDERVNFTNGFRILIDKNKSEINFQCVNLRYSPYAKKDGGQLLNFPVAYKIERQNENTSFILTPPENATLTEFKQFVTLLFITKEVTADYKVPIDKCIGEIENIYNAIPNVNLEKLAVVNGELTSKFNSDAILGNFDRLLGRTHSGNSGGSKFDTKKENVFSYLLGQARVELKVSIFPYRDGSKVIYAASLPYQMSTDGSMSGFDGPQKLKEDIEKIVND